MSKRARTLRNGSVRRTLVFGGVLLASGTLVAACASGSSDTETTPSDQGGGPTPEGGGGAGGAGGASTGGSSTGGKAGSTSTAGSGGASGGTAAGGGGTSAGGKAGTGGTSGGAGGSNAGSGGTTGGAGGKAGGGGTAGKGGGGTGGASAGTGGTGGTAGKGGTGGSTGTGGGTSVCGSDGDPCIVPNKLGVCASGSCQAGKCIENVAPMAEICDGLDNDCDGTADNGPMGTVWPDGVGMACTTGKVGVCSAGTMLCMNGMKGCVQNVQPMPEVCNGQDDDCNGQTDENIAGTACTVPNQPPNSVCAQGQTACQAGQTVCQQVNQASPEVCDGKDNDCNGTIDDPGSVNGQPCMTGLPGVCSDGTSQCIAGVPKCNPKVNPGTQMEICDGLDNDCNGQTDEINPNLLCMNNFPNAMNVQQWACTTGNCSITSCVAGYANENGSLGDGCECMADEWATSCANASTVSVNYGSSAVTRTGAISKMNGEAWFHATFSNSPAPGTAFHYKVALTNSSTGLYQMDVINGCGGGGLSCQGDGPSTGLMESGNWVMNYTSYNSGCAAAGNCVDNTPRPGEVYVRVYAVGSPKCGQTYTVSFELLPGAG